MKFILLVFLTILTFSTIGQQKKAGLSNMLIQIETESIYDKLVNVRRTFHKNPELGGKEVRTRETIRKYLLNLGIEVITDVYGHGLVGIIQGGKKSKKIAWPAEMDAFPNNFPDSA